MKKSIECPFQKVFPSQLEKGDLFFMQLAYNEAVNAWTRDEVPVGAVIAMGEEVVASAFNETRTQSDPSAHAEMIAITMAAKSVGDWRLNDCRLYVTKEPCPMCAGATVMSRLGEVHFAVDDPKMGGLGGATSLHELPFSNHKPKVFRQTMELECREMLQAFFKLQRKST